MLLNALLLIRLGEKYSEENLSQVSLLQGTDILGLREEDLAR